MMDLMRQIKIEHLIDTLIYDATKRTKTPKDRQRLCEAVQALSETLINLQSVENAAKEWDVSGITNRKKNDRGEWDPFDPACWDSKVPKKEKNETNVRPPRCVCGCRTWFDEHPFGDSCHVCCTCGRSGPWCETKAKAVKQYPTKQGGE